jgi:hypothetical protein
MDASIKEISKMEISTSSLRTKASERGSRWYRENKEIVDARVRQQRADDPKHFAVIRRKYYLANREKWQTYKARAYIRRRIDLHARARHMVAWIRLNAARAGVPFDLTVDWIRERLESGVCEVTGLKFDFTDEKRGGRHISPYAPSIDRIDGPNGYVQGNCRIVVWMYNVAKQHWSEDEVLVMARALVARHSS